MLQSVANIPPRSVYVCGNTTTTSGLTVSLISGILIYTICFVCLCNEVKMLMDYLHVKLELG